MYKLNKEKRIQIAHKLWLAARKRFPGKALILKDGKTWESNLIYHEAEGMVSVMYFVHGDNSAKQVGMMLDTMEIIQ